MLYISLCSVEKKWTDFSFRSDTSQSIEGQSDTFPVSSRVVRGQTI